MFDVQQLAQQLLAWNKQHLTATSTLTKADLKPLFSPTFTVRASGENILPTMKII